MKVKISYETKEGRRWVSPLVFEIKELSPFDNYDLECFIKQLSVATNVLWIKIYFGRESDGKDD